MRKSKAEIEAARVRRELWNSALVHAESTLRELAKQRDIQPATARTISEVADLCRARRA